MNNYADIFLTHLCASCEVFLLYRKLRFLYNKKPGQLTLSRIIYKYVILITP